MCGAIGEPSERPVIDWDRIERFVVTTRVDGGHQSQSVGKEAVHAVLKDGYSTERYVRRDTFENYPPGDVPQQWSRDYLKRFIQDTIREYGVVPNNYDQVERGPVGGVSEKTGDATDGESRPPTPDKERPVISRSSNYNIHIDDVNVPANIDQERRIRELTTEQLINFKRVFGG